MGGGVVCLSWHEVSRVVNRFSRRLASILKQSGSRGGNSSLVGSPTSRVYLLAERLLAVQRFCESRSSASPVGACATRCCPCVDPSRDEVNGFPPPTSGGLSIGGVVMHAIYSRINWSAIVTSPHNDAAVLSTSRSSLWPPHFLLTPQPSGLDLLAQILRWRPV